jgi:hypothetical protein
MHSSSDRGNQEHWNQICRRTGKCSYCPPHGGENVSYSKRGVKKRKTKNHRRKGK